VHIAVDTLGHLLALQVTPANEQERAQVADLVEEVQKVTGGSVKVAFVDQGYTGEEPAAQAAKHGVQLMVVKLEEAKRGFVLLPKRWVVERSFAWASRFRRLARDYERLPSSVAGLHWLAFPDAHAPIPPPKSAEHALGRVCKIASCGERPNCV